MINKMEIRSVTIGHILPGYNSRFFSTRLTRWHVFFSVEQLIDNMEIRYKMSRITIISLIDPFSGFSCFFSLDLYYGSSE
jgi:hypothetical protein